MLQQVWAVLIIAPVPQALRVEIAGRAGLDPVATVVERGAAMRLIRPLSRTVIVAPAVPRAALTPGPPGLDLERTPRYAERECGPHARSAA